MKELIQKFLFNKNFKRQIDWNELTKQNKFKEFFDVLRPQESTEILNDSECNILICFINSEIDFRTKITDIVSALTNKFIVPTICGNFIIALTNDFIIENNESLFSDTKTIIIRKKIHRALIDNYNPINLWLFSLSEEFLLNFRKMNFGDFLWQVQGKEKCSLIKNNIKDLWWTSRNYETCLYLIFIGFINPKIFNEKKICKIVQILRKKKFIVTNAGFIGNVMIAYKKVSDTKISELKIEGVKTLLLSKNTTIELLGDGKFLPLSPIFSFTDELIDKAS